MSTAVETCSDRPAPLEAQLEVLTAPVGAVGDSVTVATWTVLSRVTGFARVTVVAAVLGATYFANGYQFTNALPNLVYYGFLAGSLFSSLLVPAIVRYIDRGDAASAERVAGGLFGVVAVAMIPVLPIAILLAPELLRIASLGSSGVASAGQVGTGRLLIAMLMPQIVCYSVIGVATAVQNAHRRFALAAGAPVIENLGTIAVLLITWALFRPVASPADVPLAELLVLGLGSTAAVALHASVQWWGARRVGVTLRPRLGWRDEEVRGVVRRAVPSLIQAGAAATQLVVLLVLADRVAGGVVAFQIALNFYFLPVAIAATPVALSLIPRLSRVDANSREFYDVLARGIAFAAFLALPAATGYAVLSGALGHAVSLGRMNSPYAVHLVVAALRSLAPGLLGEAAFLIITYASYARHDTKTPLHAMSLQFVVCIGVAVSSFLVHGSAVLVVLGAALSAGTISGSILLYVLVTRHGHSKEKLALPLTRVAAGAAIMAYPAWLTAMLVSRYVGGRLGSELAVLAAVFAGAGIFFASQLLGRSRELRWVASSFGIGRDGLR